MYASNCRAPTEMLFVKLHKNVRAMKRCICNVLFRRLSLDLILGLGRINRNLDLSTAWSCSKVKTAYYDIDMLKRASTGVNVSLKITLKIDLEETWNKMMKKKTEAADLIRKNKPRQKWSEIEWHQSCQSHQIEKNLMNEHGKRNLLLVDNKLNEWLAGTQKNVYNIL